MLTVRRRGDGSRREIQWHHQYDDICWWRRERRVYNYDVKGSHIICNAIDRRYPAADIIGGTATDVDEETQWNASMEASGAPAESRETTGHQKV